MTAFNEDSRVKFPTIMHLVTMGFDYVSISHDSESEDILSATDYDETTNIFLSGLSSSDVNERSSVNKGIVNEYTR
jgi:type I restriction enzyme R subunit